MDAERVIVELLVKNEQFDQAAKQSAATYEGSMDRIVKAGAKAETSTASSSNARVRAINQETKALQASTRMYQGSLNDISNLLNGPNSPFVVPQKMQPAVSRSFSLVQTGALALGGVIGGVLAAAVLSYVASLAEMILKQKDAESEIAGMVEKLKEQARQSKLNEAAQAEFGQTIEGVTAALDDNEQALERLENAGKSAAFQAAVNAEKQRLQTIEIRAGTVALIEQAQAQLEVLRAQALANGSSLRETGVGAEIGQIEGRLKSLQAKLGVAQAELKRAEDQFRQALSRAAVERGSEGEVEGIRRKYDRLVESTRKRLVAEGAIAAEIVKQTQALREQQRIEEEAARKRKSSDSGQSGRQINEAQARAIVKSIGGVPTSGFRTAQHNEDVGGVPNSFHLKGQALDIAKTAGITLAKIVKAFEDQGVRLIEKLDEGDHFHIAFAKRGGSGPSQETLAKRAAAAALEAERRELAFANERAGLDQQLIDARQALVFSAEEIAKLELEAIEQARVQYNEKLASLVEQNRISGGTKGLLAEEAAELQKLNDERAKLRTDLVKAREDQRKFRMAEADARRAVEANLGSKQVQAELLQSQAGLATTIRERRDLERKLLDMQFEMERIQLQAIIAEYERLKIKKDLTDQERQELADKKLQADLARERLGTSGERQSNAQDANSLSNAPPLQDFFNQIPDTAGEINEAFESIAAGGLASLTDGLTEAIMGFRSFGDVGRAVLQQLAAGIIKLGIQQLLLHTIGKVIGKATIASTVAQATSVAAAWAPAAALASLATLGANAAPAAAALAGTHALSLGIAATSAVGGAGGGFQSGGFTGMGATNKPAGIVHGQEYVFDADATRRIGVHNLEAIRSGNIRPSNAAAVAPRGSTGGGFGPEAIAQLGGIVKGAIEAMPPINLFPTYDPVAALEAALNQRRGRQVMAEFMGDNRGTMGSALTP